MTTCFLGFGSNLGDRAAMIGDALSHLVAAHIIHNPVISSLYESPALLAAGAPEAWNLPFLNAVVKAETDLPPDALLAATQATEWLLGKQKRGHWGPREIDIDLLAYGDHILQTDVLTLPHPHLQDRDFVVLPWHEIAPEWVHPVTGHSVLQMSGALTSPFAARTLPLPAGFSNGAKNNTQIVGIANVTPDSFSDGGVAHTPHDALRHIGQLLDEGADIIDIGAESTRPGAEPLCADMEWERLSPVLADAIRLIHASGKRASLDTRHPQNARKAIALGIDWVNDVGGLHLPEMLDAVRGSECKLVLMHSLSVPADPRHTLPDETDMVPWMRNWFEARLATLEEQGIARHRLILDPGIGFGKTPQQSLTLVRHAGLLRPLGAEMLVGHSRKSFLAAFFNAQPDARDPLTRLVSSVLRQSGIEYLRVHDVKGHRHA